MRFRLGCASGFAAGYYLGAKAGRQRYDQMNRTLRKLRRSPTFEAATEKAKTVVEDSVDKAKTVFENKVGDGRAPNANATNPTNDVPPTRLGV